MTAEECLNSYVDDFYEISTEGAHSAMIEFAKYHVEACKKAYFEEIKEEGLVTEAGIHYLERAYPLENIK